MMAHRFFVEFCILSLLALVALDAVEALGRPPASMSTVGEYGPQNQPPKPYSFNYEVTDAEGNVHFHREQGDQTGIVTGTYGYTKVNGLYRSVEYMANKEGYRAKVKTNEPGTKGPGSADVDLQVEPAPLGLQEVFERKPPSVAPTPAPRPSYPGIKG